ncbi:MAG: HEPN domain-containing protein [Magnetococcales bacterium]|nr:HEPN domain-containing protein [Magnetococcales bacterium]
MDIAKHVLYWKTGSQEDWEVAEQLVASGKSRHGLFFVHLALEKILKGHVCQVQRDIPPRIHNLIRLAELANLTLDAEQTKLFEEINDFNIAGRYAGEVEPSVTRNDAVVYAKKAHEVLQWLIQQLVLP